LKLRDRVTLHRTERRFLRRRRHGNGHDGLGFLWLGIDRLLRVNRNREQHGEPGTSYESPPKARAARDFVNAHLVLLRRG
jgi:hypothetical protein